MVLNGLWSRFVEYFSVEVVGDDPLPKDRSTVYAVIPHGTFPFGLGVVSGCKRTIICDRGVFPSFIVLTLASLLFFPPSGLPRSLEQDLQQSTTRRRLGRLALSGK